MPVYVITQLKMTPLHWAVEKGHLQAIQILIKQGSDISCENKVRFPTEIVCTNVVEFH